MTLRIIRTTLLLAFLFGIVGSGAELLLLGHTEDIWQYVPLILSGSALSVFIWGRLAPSTAALQTFRILMLLFVLSGAVGVFLHVKGNIEFEREMYPDLTGLKLYWEAMSGATPALAPGAMTLLGLLGFAYSGLNTILQRSDSDESTGANTETSSTQ